jgi:chromosome segregation ATPase
VTDDRLALLRELVRADEAHRATLAELDELARRTAAVRKRADGLAAFLAAAPEERERVEKALEQAEGEIEERRAALAAAEAELAAAEAREDEERLAAARRSVVRAKDALSIAEKRAAASRVEQAELERRVAAAEREAPEVEGLAAELAGSLRGRPRVAEDAGRSPAPGLAGVSEWASGARAALLVARAGVAAEREAMIRQANELGSAILGEPLAAESADAVARRIERALCSHL